MPQTNLVTGTSHLTGGGNRSSVEFKMNRVGLVPEGLDLLAARYVNYR